MRKYFFLSRLTYIKQIRCSNQIKIKIIYESLSFKISGDSKDW